MDNSNDERQRFIDERQRFQADKPKAQTENDRLRKVQESEILDI